MIWKINSLAKKVPVDYPSKFKDAKYWDSMSV